MINRGTGRETTYLLKRCATDIDNINSENHVYDMQYILETTADNLNDKMRQLIFDKQGIYSEKHLEYLEKLSKSESIDEDIFSYPDELYQHIENNKEEIVNNKV